MPTAPAPACLFLVFNRPGVTARVFEAIRQARPPRLYVACDGPRPQRPGEAELVREVRRITSAVDWPCELRTLLRDENLGCKRAVSSAVGWFFDQEPEGIVLEDDCVPAPDFFPYCAHLLERFRDDERIGWISGTALCDLRTAGFLWGDEDFVYCRYPSVWGWASWRRVWRDYDVDMRLWTPRRMDILAIDSTQAVRSHHARLFDRVARGRIDTWDYQVSTLLWTSHRLAIAPRRNLVDNIGFGADATHTRSVSILTARARTDGAASLSFPLRAPPAVLPNANYQHYLESLATRPIWRRVLDRLMLHAAGAGAGRSDAQAQRTSA